MRKRLVGTTSTVEEITSEMAQAYLSPNGTGGGHHGSKPGKMRTTIELITPALAAEYLKLNTKNRRHRPWKSDQFARIIVAGDWKVTHQGIAFGTDNSLKDGQHRLHGIVKAGIAVHVMVTRNMPDEAMIAIDQGTLRSLEDVLGALDLGFDVTRQDVAVARAMIAGLNDKVRLTRTGPDIKRFLIRHHEAVKFAVAVATNSVAKHSCIRAPIARAWYSADRARLARFAECLGNGIVEGRADAAATMLHTFFQRERLTFSGFAGRVRLYCKAEAALRAFLERKPIRALREVEAEVFPIPDDADPEGE
jgi:hypothetical protein